MRLVLPHFAGHLPAWCFAFDRLGILGGSGLYEIAGLKNAEWRRVASPFGETSDEFLFGVLDGLDVVFVPRHGRGHRHSPTSINYRANIDVLKRCGVTDILSLSACGSLKEEMAPGDLVAPHDVLDEGRGGPHTFYPGVGWGFIRHNPLFCPDREAARRMEERISAVRSQALGLRLATSLKRAHSSLMCTRCSSGVRPAADRMAVSNIGYTCTGR